MRKETLQAKKARLFKTSKSYKLVLANIKEIRETESLINKQLDVLSKYIDECKKEKFAQLKKKRALETGDVVTMEVQDVDSGGDEDFDADTDDMGNDFEGAEDGGPDEVVDMEKEMKKIQSRINRLKQNRK